MNKEFLDPNTKYSDQKVDLAKMPGMLKAISQSLEEMAEGVDAIPALQQQVGKLSSTVEDIDDNVGGIQDTLSTTGARAGQVLKVGTPGEAPVWGEAGGGVKLITTTYFSLNVKANNDCTIYGPINAYGLSERFDTNKTHVPLVQYDSGSLPTVNSPIVIISKVDYSNDHLSYTVRVFRSPQDADNTVDSANVKVRIATLEF